MLPDTCTAASSGPANALGSLPSTPAFEESVSLISEDYVVKNTFIDVPPVGVLPRSQSWSSGQNASSGNSTPFPDCSNASSVSGSSQFGRDKSRHRTGSSRPEVKPPPPATLPGGKCFYCRKDHEACARPNKQRRLNLKKLLKEITMQPDDHQRDLAYSRFLKHGPFACKLLTIFCPDLDMEKIASLYEGTDESDDELELPRTPGAFQASVTQSEGITSAPPRPALPLTPGQVEAGSMGFTKLSL